VNSQQLTKWGERYGLNLQQVRRLQRLIYKRKREVERYLNGDPHPLVLDRTDKNLCSKMWEADSDRTDGQLLAYAKQVGFDGVDFGVGLYPALMKGDETCIMVP
jgi:hypothetical protein